MIKTTMTAILPVGEFDTDQIKFEFEAILRAVKLSDTELVIADPVGRCKSARQSVGELSKKDPDLNLIIPLRGLSAQVIEAAAMTSLVPCLICPVQGEFACFPAASWALEHCVLRKSRSSCYMRLRTILTLSKDSGL